MLIPHKYRALIVTFLAFHIDTLLYYFLVPLLPHYAKTLSLNPSQIGILFGSYAVALLISTYPVAILCNRYGKRTPMLLGLVGLGIATTLFALGSSFGWLLFARSMQGAAGALTWVPGMALLADHFPNEERGKAMSLSFMGANLGVFIGPSLSGVLATRWGYTAPFWIGIGLIIIDGLGRMAIKDIPSGVVTPPLSLKHLLKNRVIQTYAFAMMLSMTIWSYLESALPMYLDEKFALNARGIGFLFGFLAVAHGLSSPFIGSMSDKVDRIKILRFGLIGIAVLILVIPFGSAVASLTVVLSALGLLTSFLISPCSPGVAREIDQLKNRAYASGFSILNLSYSSGMVAGSLLASIIVGPFGLSGGLLVLSVLCLFLLKFTFSPPHLPTNNQLVE